MDKTEILLDKIRAFNKKGPRELFTELFQSLPNLELALRLDCSPEAGDFEHDEVQKAIRDVFYLILAIAGEKAVCFSCIIKDINEKLHQDQADGSEILVMPPRVINTNNTGGSPENINSTEKRRNYQFWIRPVVITDPQTGETQSSFYIKVPKNTYHLQGWFWMELVQELKKVTGFPWLAEELDDETISFRAFNNVDEIILDYDYLLQGERITKI